MKTAEEMLDNAFWMEDSMAKGLIIQAFKDYASQALDRMAENYNNGFDSRIESSLTQTKSELNERIKMKKSAMQQLIEWLIEYNYVKDYEIKEKSQELLELEKKQIIDAFDNGWAYAIGSHKDFQQTHPNSKDYYKKTYSND